MSEAEKAAQAKKREEKIAQFNADYCLYGDFPPQRRKGGLPHQEFAGRIYNNDHIQNTVAVVIMLNFVVSGAEAQWNVEGEHSSLFEKLELTFNILFLVELLLNFYANFFFAFWRERWNNFDFLIVSAAWISWLFPNHESAPILKLSRPFRVFRLCRRVEALRVILVGIGKSLPGVRDACIVLLLIMGIWSIMGVEFFGGTAGDFQDWFGTFARALLSMFQISTLDSWSSQIARKIILWPSYSVFTFVYFITYSFITSIILLNVIVAILLAGFEETKQKEDEKKKSKAKNKTMLRRVIKLHRQVRVWLARREVAKKVKARRLKREGAALTMQRAARLWIAEVQRKRRANVPGAHDEEEANLREMCERVGQLHMRTETWYLEIMRKLASVTRAVNHEGFSPGNDRRPGVW